MASSSSALSRATLPAEPASASAAGVPADDALAVLSVLSALSDAPRVSVPPKLSPPRGVPERSELFRSVSRSVSSGSLGL